MSTNDDPGARDREQEARERRSDEDGEALDAARDGVRRGQLGRDCARAPASARPAPTGTASCAIAAAIASA